MRPSRRRSSISDLFSLRYFLSDVMLQLFFQCFSNWCNQEYVVDHHFRFWNLLSSTRRSELHLSFFSDAHLYCQVYSHQAVLNFKVISTFIFLITGCCQEFHHGHCFPTEVFAACSHAQVSSLASPLCVPVIPCRTRLQSPHPWVGNSSIDSFCPCRDLHLSTLLQI